MKALPITLAMLLALASSFPVSGQSSCANASLSTPFNAIGGQSGNMFDIVCTNPLNVLIESVECDLDAGTWDMEIYAVTGGGSHVGIEQNASAWTFVGSATGIVGAGQFLPTVVPIPINIVIANTQTQGFYVTVSNGTSMNYTNGTSTHVVGQILASNADIDILAGTGNAYPFSSVFQPGAVGLVTDTWYDFLDVTLNPGTLPASLGGIIPPAVAPAPGTPVNTILFQDDTTGNYVWTGS